MASPQSTTPSPPSSPPASLLIETIDYRNNTTAQSVVQEPSQELPQPISPSSSDGSNRTITQRDLAPPLSPSASSDRTITRGDLAGPAHQGSQPPQNPPTFPVITDHIPTHAALDNLERQYRYGVDGFPHIHLQIGRELRAKPKTMDPAPPARVVQRNDFNWPIPNGDPSDKRLASKGRTTCLGPRVVTYNDPKENTKETVETPTAAAATATGATTAAPPTAPAKVPGISGTEGLAGLGDELEALVLTKVEYIDKFCVFRERWNKVQGELAARAKQVEGTRFTTAAELRPFVGTIGVMVAVGRAVDQAAFPGEQVGQFEEQACSPEGYLSSLFPELNGASAGAGGAFLPKQWDFSLDAIMAEERRDLLREVWDAAAAGKWEEVDEMTSGTLAKAEELAKEE